MNEMTNKLTHENLRGKKRDEKRARLDLEDEPQVVGDSWLGQIGVGAWMDAAEGICLRAGNLRSRLERDFI